VTVDTVRVDGLDGVARAVVHGLAPGILVMAGLVRAPRHTLDRSLSLEPIDRAPVVRKGDGRVATDDH